MMERQPSEKEMRDAMLKDAKRTARESVIPTSMNRAERRTAYGRMLEAQAEAASMRAEIEFLRSELGLDDGS